VIPSNAIATYRPTRACSRPPSAREIVAILALSYAARLRRRLIRNPLERAAYNLTSQEPFVFTAIHTISVLEHITVQVRSIWIENEITVDEHGRTHDPTDTNSDVIVTMTDRSRWVATFFSYTNIDSLVAKNRVSGECLSGRYFWASDMILVDEVTRERIEAIIKDLLTTHEFQAIFTRCATDDEEPEDANRLL
jgi:hypothetical protein